MTTRLNAERVTLDSLDQATEYFFEQGWTDGLPILPPTEDKVARFLAACRRQPDEVVMDIPARGRKVTAGKVAINAVMAGCKPEYMPVVMAAVEAMNDPAFNFHGALNSTMGAAVMVIVNGPVRKKLAINSGGNLFGQGWRANATIGRALRLVVMNACGGTPGTLDRATFGHGGKYSFCFAENEELSPWEPLHVERGFQLDASAVTVAAALAPLQTYDHLHHTAEGVVGHIGMGLSSFGGPLHEAVVVISPEHLWHIKRAGWSKRQVKEHLFRTARTTVAAQKRRGAFEGAPTPEDERAEVGVLVRPESCIVTVGGGDAGGFSAVIPIWSWGRLSRTVTKLVREP